jgi:hypothetical protein
MIGAMARHGVQVLRAAGKTLKETAVAAGVSQRSVQRIELEQPLETVADLLQARPRSVGRPSVAAPWRERVVAVLAAEPTLPTMEILHRLREERYTGGKTALHELVRELRPKPSVPLVRFEGVADIADARRNDNPHLEVLGVVVNAVDARTKTWHEVNQLIHINFPGRAFSTVISRAQAVSDATKVGKTLFQIPKFRRHPVVIQYRQLAAEVHARITNREAFLQGGFDAIPRLVALGPPDAVPESANEAAVAANV